MPLLERVIAIREKTLGPEHSHLAISLGNLALVYYATGEYTRAEPLFERALANDEKALGPEHPDVAVSLNNLAGLYWFTGEYARAAPLYERSLAITEKALGPEHPQVPSERLPNAVKEAMLRRCVPVITWSEGIEELVADGVEGGSASVRSPGPARRDARI